MVLASGYTSTYFVRIHNENIEKFNDINELYEMYYVKELL